MDTQGTRSIGSPWFLCRGQPFEAQDSLNDAGGGIALPSQKDTSQTVYHPRASGLLRGGRTPFGTGRQTTDLQNTPCGGQGQALPEKPALVVSAKQSNVVRSWRAGISGKSE